MTMNRISLPKFRRRIAKIAAFLALTFAFAAAAPPRARAQGSRKDDIALGPRGTPLAGASVAICTQPAVTTTAPCSPLATLYSNVALTQALANPLTADGLGNYNFYATPGKYTIQIYGPGLTTRVLPDVILPSDPSSPTFATVTTTSGITAFSLTLSGNLTVAGNSAITGTLTVAGAQVPSTSQDLQWSTNQRFKGPIPERDITAYGPPGGCPQLTYFAPPSGTISSGSHTLTVAGGAMYQTNGCGVAVYAAGPNSTLATPGAITVSAHSYTGSTTYCYEVAAVDNNLGMSAASAHTCITNGVAALGRDSYNFLQWTSVANAVEYVVYESATAGGTYTAIGTAVDSGTDGLSAYCDAGLFTQMTSGHAGSGYAVGDTGFISGGNGLAEYKVLTVTSGAVTSFALIAEGSGYLSSTGNSTSTGGAQPGSGSGLQIDVQTVPVPDFAPSTAPGAVTAQALFTTISSGGGTSTLTLTAAASNTATSKPVYQDDSWMLAAALAAFTAGTDGFAPIYVIPPGVYWFPHLPATISANSSKIEQRGTVYLTGLPLFGNSIWIGYGGYGGLSGGGGQYTPISMSANVAAAFVRGSGDIENISVVNTFGDGIDITGGAEGVRLDTIAVSEAVNGAGSPIRVDGDTIVLYGRNWTLQANQSSGGLPALWFNRETNTNPDSDIRIFQMWLAFHSIKFDAPGGTNGNPNQLISINQAQTEENFDHGFVVVDGGASGSETSIMGLNLQDAAADSNFSNFNPLILTIGPKGANVSSVYPVIVSGTTVPNSYAGVQGITLSGGVSTGGQFGGNLGAGNPPLQAPSGSGIGLTAITPAGILAGGNLGVMAQPNIAGNVQWAQVVPPPAAGTAFTPTAITGTGSLAAGTYYYQMTCRQPDGGETAAGPEYVVTLAATGEINWAITDIQPGCIGGLRFYRGTTSGGENVWLNKSGTYYTMGTGGLYSVGWNDDGTYTSNSATPPGFGNAFYSKLMMDGNSFSYLLADNPFLFASNNTRLGIGTMTDPGSSSGIKLDIAGGYTRAQSGFLTGPATAFSSLPSCAAGTEGLQRTVSDSTTNTWGATITGGGANVVLAFCDATNWTVAAK